MYSPDNLSQVQQVIAIAASHHRLVWIHPFLDGNGRVARLYSHALLLHSEVGSNLWSISRGLARKVEIYKSTLMAADAARKGDLDGRGSLSHEELVNFCRFFLETCIDQVGFMTKLLDVDQLLPRMEIHVREEIAGKRLPKGTFLLLREAFYTGEFRRGKVTEITGYQERQARGDIIQTPGKRLSYIRHGARACAAWLPPASSRTLVAGVVSDLMTEFCIPLFTNSTSRHHPALNHFQCARQAGQHLIPGPATAGYTSMEGETPLPVTATLRGWAILPNFIACCPATASMAA